MYSLKNNQSVIDKALEILEHEPVYKSVSASEAVTGPKILRTISTLKIGAKEREVFMVFFFDSQHRILSNEELFMGTVNQSAIYCREIAKRALELNAVCVAFAHNHPSGNTRPSASDIDITKRLTTALAYLEIGVLDHLIVSTNISDAFSFAEHKLI